MPNPFKLIYSTYRYGFLYSSSQFFTLHYIFQLFHKKQHKKFKGPNSGTTEVWKCIFVKKNPLYLRSMIMSETVSKITLIFCGYSRAGTLNSTQQPWESLTWLNYLPSIIWSGLYSSLLWVLHVRISIIPSLG